MGAGWSKSQAAWVQFDKPYYHDGDIVSCLVCLNIVSPVKVEAIECQLQGVENTYWTETRSHTDGDHSHTYTETYGGTVQLMGVTVPLGGGNRELPPGQYQWQLAFGLPVGLPSSFRVSSAGDYAEVVYTVNVTFHTPGFMSRAIRSSQALTVRQRVQSPPEIVDQSAELPMVACCCFNRGVLNAHVRLDRDKAQPGEQVAVILEVDNRSKLPVDAIEVCLKREAVARERVKGGSTQRFHKELAPTKHQGVAAFTTLQGGMARQLQVQLPLELPPTTYGAIVRCDYFVKVKMNIGSFVKDVKLKVPLVVLAPQPVPTVEAPFFLEPPPFWSPGEVALPMGIAVPSAPQLPPEVLRPDAPFWSRANSHASSSGGASLTTPLLGADGGSTAGYPAGYQVV